MKNTYTAPEFNILPSLEDKYCLEENASTGNENAFGADNIIVKDTL